MNLAQDAFGRVQKIVLFACGARFAPLAEQRNLVPKEGTRYVWQSARRRCKHARMRAAPLKRAISLPKRQPKIRGRAFPMHGGAQARPCMGLGRLHDRDEVSPSLLQALRSKYTA